MATLKQARIPSPILHLPFLSKPFNACPLLGGAEQRNAPQEPRGKKDASAPQGAENILRVRQKKIKKCWSGHQRGDARSKVYPKRMKQTFCLIIVRSEIWAHLREKSLLKLVDPKSEPFNLPNRDEAVILPEHL